MRGFHWRKRDLLEKKQVMQKLKEMRSTEVEEWRDTVVAGVGQLGWQQLGLEAPKRRVISVCPPWEIVQRVKRRVGSSCTASEQHWALDMRGNKSTEKVFKFFEIAK